MTKDRGRREMGLVLRTLAALVVWLGAGSHLAGLAHFALISHHVCAAHGELVHDDHLDAAPLPTAAVDGGASVATDETAGEEHEHCSVLARRQEQLSTPSARCAALAPSVVDEAKVLRPEVPPRRSERLWVVAPKTSPPV